MRYFLRVLLREYRDIFSDHGVLTIFIAGLAVYTMIYPIPYSPEVVKEIPVVAVDQDNSAMSRKLVRWLEATEEVRLVLPTRDLGEARQHVLNSEARGIFVIPEGFERDILRGEQANVSVYADACYFVLYTRIATGALKATATLSAGIEIRRMTAAGFGEQHAKDARDPAPLATRALFNPAGGYATYVVPPVLILILQQTLLIGIGMLGGTRNENFNENCLRDCPVRESALVTLIGRGFAYFSLYILYPIFYLFVVYRVYDLPMVGSLLEVLIFLVPYVLAVTFLGLALTAWLPSREMSIPVLIYTSVPAVFLMGFAWPFEAVPAWLQNVSLLLPSTTGCVGFVRLNQMGAHLRDVQFEWYTQWALSIFYFTLAWLTMFGHRPRHCREAARLAKAMERAPKE